MPIFLDAKKEVLILLKSAIGKGQSPTIDELEAPKNDEMGDIAFPCFVFAKGMKRNPNEIATEIAAKIAPSGYIKKAEANGPYINFFLDPATYGEALLKKIETKKELYGNSDLGNKKVVMVEFASLNTHKDTHVGHLRNILVGQMMVNVLKAAGYRVVASTYIGDLGTHVSRCLWGMQKFHEDETPEPGKENQLLGQAYVEAVQALEKDPNIKEEIDAISRDLELKKGDYKTLWEKTREWSLVEMRDLFDELGLKLDVWYFESDFGKSAKKIIADLQKKGVVVESQGALIVDLSDEDLGANLLVKSDGTLLYNGRDIALAYKKEKDFHPSKSIYVIDMRQSLAMKQLFTTMKRIGFDEELVHLSYEFVTLKEGAMASRKGNVIRYEDFLERMVQMAAKETASRHEDWDKEKVHDAAMAVAFSAMKFGMLKQDLDKQIVFDIEESMSFEGFTGPYLLYTYARIQSLFRKADRKIENFDTSLYNHKTEHALLLQLSKYPIVLSEIAIDFSLSRLSQYLFDLAKTFAEFYASVTVLGSEDEKLIAARLGLVRGVSQVMKNGLGVLGIETVDEM